MGWPDAFALVGTVWGFVLLVAYYVALKLGG